MRVMAFSADVLVLAAAVPTFPVVVIAANVLRRSAGTRLPSSGRIEVVGVHGAGPKIVCLAETVSAPGNHFGAPGKCFAI